MNVLLCLAETQTTPTNIRDKRRNTMNEATILAVVAQVYARKVQVQTSIAISGFT